MTGLDRLRELACGIGQCDVWTVTREEYDDAHGLDIEHRGGRLHDLLADIADQIEAEQEERVTRRLEDREAAEWVREHGGLEAVKNEWRSRNNLKRMYEKEKAKVERQQRHIEFVQGKCRERQGHIVELNKMVGEMRPRLIPEGCEWPRYEDGKPFIPGDGGSVEFFGDGIFNVWINGDHQHLARGERVKRPAVLAADDEPLEAGQTVWEVATGEEYAVVEIYHGTTEPDFPLHCVKCERDGDVVSHMFEPSQLTHTKPEPHDTWDQIKADADLCPFDYAWKFGKRQGQSDAEFQRKDLVRRCKELAGVS